MKKGLVVCFYACVLVLGASQNSRAEGDEICLSDLHALLKSANKSQQATLPASCQKIGPIYLGMEYSDVIRSLGDPDKTTRNGSRLTTTYIYPRDINHRLLNHPQNLSDIRYSLLAIVYSNNKVSAIDAMVYPGTEFPYEFYGQSFGVPVEELIEKIGAKPVWNTPKDTVMYPPLPINFSVGSSNGQVYGLNIADTASDMSRLPGLKVEYQEKTKLVKSLH